MIRAALISALDRLMTRAVLKPCLPPDFSRMHLAIVFANLPLGNNPARSMGDSTMDTNHFGFCSVNALEHRHINHNNLPHLF